MKIRTRRGEIIDLRHIRETSMYEAAKDSSAYYPARMLEILDALEAALSVPRSTSPTSAWAQGWDTCRNVHREKAGMIEDDGAAYTIACTSHDIDPATYANLIDCDVYGDVHRKPKCEEPA